MTARRGARGTRILLFDIETTPIEAYVWGLYEQNVIRVKHEWRILSFAYKWLGEKKIYFIRAPHNDAHLVKELWKLFDEADMLVAHNGNRFDFKKVCSRFISYGLTSPSPYKTVDTRLVSRRYFGFNSNKLDDLGEYLGVGRKVKHEGFDLWLRCLSGDERAWKTMEKYNKQDVALLEKIYLKMRPYMVTYHKLVFDGTCQHCGSTDVYFRGTCRTRTRVGRRFQCKKCGVWGSKY